MPTLLKYLFINTHSFKSSFGILCFILIFTLGFSNTVIAQSDENFDEISVILNVQRIGSTEIPIVIYRQTSYLPIKEVFDFLRIKSAISSDRESVDGYFMTPNAVFLIDNENKKIEYQGKVYKLKADDLFKTETNLYLKSEFFGQIFGLDCSFSFRSLSVLMTTKIELPAIIEMQQEILRLNINKLKGEKKADTTIGRGFPLFNLGIADWAIFSTQQTNLKSNTRLSLALGAIVAGGETNVYLNINSTVPFRKQDQYYNWRYVNNEFKPIRQVTLGTIFTQSTSTIYAPVKGVQITNTPTTYRRSFGTYTISNKTDPGWTVELYINNVLVNYVKADASGFYTFEVPMVYGNSVVKLRFYSPWGEVRTSEQNLNIPFNFLPSKQIEYSITSGVVQDIEKSKFSRANLNYGLSRIITVGAGMEHLSTANNGNPISFVSSSIRVGSRLLFNGEHVFGVISRGILTYQFPSRVKFEINYGKYQKDQTSIRSGKGSSNNFLEERKFVASVPIRTKKFAAFTRLTVNQLVLPKIKYTTGEFLISAILAGVSTNITTAITYTDPAHKMINSSLSATLRLSKGIRFTPLVQYDYSQNNFTRIRTEFEKNLTSKGFLNITYERDVLKNLSYYGLGLRYNFSYAQLSFFGRNSKSGSSMTEAVNGSILYNDKSKALKVSNQNNVGRAGLIIIPFLDINCNGKRDKGEPRVQEVGMRINAGRTTYNEKDTSIIVIGLEAYNQYFIDMDKNSFDNIAWKIKNPSIKVIAEPNHFKKIEVPISVMGEASGKVTLNSDMANKGIGRIIVNIYNKDSIFVARVMTEADGYFSYVGLIPGDYFASVDEAQLKKLNLFTLKNRSVFSIKENREGDVVDNLVFSVYSKENSIIE